MRVVIAEGQTLQVVVDPHPQVVGDSLADAFRVVVVDVGCDAVNQGDEHDRTRRQRCERRPVRLSIWCGDVQDHAQKVVKMVYTCFIVRTNIDVDESLVRQARRLTGLKTKRQIVDKALELLVRSESRKGILRYYGSGIWKGDQKAARRNRT